MSTVTVELEHRPESEHFVPSQDALATQASPRLVQALLETLDIIRERVPPASDVGELIARCLAVANALQVRVRTP